MTTTVYRIGLDLTDCNRARSDFDSKMFTPRLKPDKEVDILVTVSGRQVELSFEDLRDFAVGKYD